MSSLNDVTLTRFARTSSHFETTVDLLLKWLSNHGVDRPEIRTASLREVAIEDSSAQYELDRRIAMPPTFIVLRSKWHDRHLRGVVLGRRH
jgi:hypothetical protein